MFFHHSREGRAGWRFWWHFGANSRNCIGIEAYWWSRSCHVQASVGDEGWRASMALPPFALYLKLDIRALWRPMKRHVFHWDNDRVVMLADQRESRIAIHDWKLWIVPWGKSMEWCRRDPWWVRGITIEPARLLGRWEGSHEDLAKVPVTIPMPEGLYHGVATVQRWVRGRRYWFKSRTQSVRLDIPGGIPHAGKGENSWDCGDDGLFGIGGSSINEAIQNARNAVLRDRKRYGHASDESVRKALAGPSPAISVSEP